MPSKPSSAPPIREARQLPSKPSMAPQPRAHDVYADESSSSDDEEDY